MRGTGRERETLILARNLNWLHSATEVCALTKNRTHNFLMHRTTLKQLSHSGYARIILIFKIFFYI